LWGIADDPFCRCAKGSSSSEISVCWSSRTVVASRSRLAPRMAIEATKAA